MGCIKKGRGGGERGGKSFLLLSSIVSSSVDIFFFFRDRFLCFVMFAGYGDNFKFNLLFLSFFS